MPDINLDPNDLSRYANLTVLETTYKTVSGHPITTAVLIPKSLADVVSAPVVLRYHGGGFVCASNLFPGFFQPWHFELAERHGAVIVTPNFRLVPEAGMDDVLADVEDHWTWVRSELAGFVDRETNGRVSVDVERVLVTGDSAGGYLSLMTGLMHTDEVRGCVAAYPVIDLKHPHFTEGTGGKPTLGVGPLPAAIAEEHIRKVREGELPGIVSADPKFERAGLMFSLTHNGLSKNLFPAEKRHLFPLDLLEDGARFPRGGVLVFHGRDDTVVPVEGSVKLEEKVAEVDPGSGFRLCLRPGEHGFDHDAKLDEDWLAGGLEKLVEAWLR